MALGNDSLVMRNGALHYQRNPERYASEVGTQAKHSENPSVLQLKNQKENRIYREDHHNNDANKK